MGRTKIIAGLTLLLGLVGCSASCASTSPSIRVGSKNFTEQVVLGEIIAQHLEHRLNQKVERSLNLGGTLLAHDRVPQDDVERALRAALGREEAGV